MYICNFALCYNRTPITDSFCEKHYTNKHEFNLTLKSTAACLTLNHPLPQLCLFSCCSHGRQCSLKKIVYTILLILQNIMTPICPFSKPLVLLLCGRDAGAYSSVSDCRQGNMDGWPVHWMDKYNIVIKKDPRTEIHGISHHPS